MSKIQPHQIDFKDVTFIYQKIMDKDEQNWSIYLDDSYSLLSRELAGCCIADEQLFTISAGFSLYYKLTKSKMTIKNAEENLLISYNEINIDGINVNKAKNVMYFLFAFDPAISISTFNEFFTSKKIIKKNNNKKATFIISIS